MKKILFVVLVFLALAPVNAQDKKHNFSLSFETSDYSYKEPNLEYPPHWTGTMYGVSAKYTGRGLFSESAEDLSSDKTFLALELRYMQGDTDYDGFLQDGTPFKGNNIGDYYIEGAITAGAVYNLTQSGLSLWPYLGLGARYLVDRLDDLGDSGYRRESTYIYLPLGFNLKQDFSKGWSLSANGQLDVLLSGRQSSKGIADVDINNDQEEGYGLRGSVKLEKQFDKFGIFLEPFIRYWHIQNSEEVLISDGYYIYSFIEPKNETREYGLKIGITF